MMHQSNPGRNDTVGAIATAALCAMAWPGFALAPDRHVVASTLVPDVIFAIDDAFEALPLLAFPIEDLTNAERLIFVEADGSRRVGRAIVLQFERVQQGSDFRFVFPSTPPEELGRHQFRFGAFAYDDAEAARRNPGREAGLTRAHFEKFGFSPPRYWRVARLARVADSKGESEIIVFYMENADTAYSKTGLVGADSDGDLALEPAVASALLGRLREHVAVVAD